MTRKEVAEFAAVWPLSQKELLEFASGKANLLTDEELFEVFIKLQTGVMKLPQVRLLCGLPCPCEQANAGVA
jgi:hypothetical protein